MNTDNHKNCQSKTIKNVGNDGNCKQVDTKHSPSINFRPKEKRRAGIGQIVRGSVITLTVFVFTLFIIQIYSEKKITPVLGDLAQARAKEYLTETVNRVVGELSAEGKLEYVDMVTTRSDSNGQVIYLEVDTEMLGMAKSEIVERIDKSLSNNKYITVSVPFGTLTGINLFSAKGFPVRVRVYPIGIAEGEIYTELEDCGINQTRHLISIKVNAEIYLILPDENRSVSTEVILPLGERVLIGDVPEIYLDNIGAS